MRLWIAMLSVLLSLRRACRCDRRQRLASTYSLILNVWWILHNANSHCSFQQCVCVYSSELFSFELDVAEVTFFFFSHLLLECKLRHSSGDKQINLLYSQAHELWRHLENTHEQGQGTSLSRIQFHGNDSELFLTLTHIFHFFFKMSNS